MKPKRFSLVIGLSLVLILSALLIMGGVMLETQGMPWGDRLAIFSSSAAFFIIYHVVIYKLFIAIFLGM